MNSSWEIDIDEVVNDKSHSNPLACARMNFSCVAKRHDSMPAFDVDTKNSECWNIITTYLMAVTINRIIFSIRTAMIEVGYEFEF